MNEFQKRLYSMPSIHLGYCPFCGKPPQNRHHIVPRSQGGHDGATVDVCGFGNASGCHGLLHSHRIHLRPDKTGEWWEWILLQAPAKYEVAIQKKGWVPVDGPRDGF